MGEWLSAQAEVWGKATFTNELFVLFVEDFILRVAFSLRRSWVGTGDGRRGRRAGKALCSSASGRTVHGLG